jgi:hypothetical protein
MLHRAAAGQAGIGTLLRSAISNCGLDISPQKLYQIFKNMFGVILMEMLVFGFYFLHARRLFQHFNITPFKLRMMRQTLLNL